MPDRPLATVVLAAGAGTRMASAVPKPLHPLCGRAMVLHVLHAVAPLRARPVVVVVGHESALVTKSVLEGAPDGLDLRFAEQATRRGTGHATLVGLGPLDDDDLDEGDVLVVPGDSPLLSADTLAGLIARHRETAAAATLLTARLEDPTGYGRVLRASDDRVVGIVEQRDARPDQLLLDEVGTSVYCFRRSLLAPALRRTSPTNAQGEYYLTDVVGVLAAAGHRVEALVAADPAEAAGVNDPVQLAGAEAELRRRINDRWMRAGVRMADPATTYVDVTVELAPGVSLLPGTVLAGRTTVGRGATVGPACELIDCRVGPGAVVRHSVGVHAEIGSRAVVGPYVDLPGGSRVEPDEIRTGPATGDPRTAGSYAPGPDDDR